MFPLRKRSKIRSIKTSLIGFCLTIALIVSTAAPAQATPTEPLCRFGVNHHGQPGLTSISGIGSLNAGYFIDYSADATAKPPGMQQLRMVRLKQFNKNSTNYTVSPSLSTITTIAQANPGSFWLIGNEPDRIYYQDDLTPAAYARAYHELRQAIKAADPTAILVPGNIVQASPVRLRYLDLVLAEHRAAYGAEMEVDAWGIHAFVLNEKPGEWGADVPRGVSPEGAWVLRTDQNADFGLFQQQIVAFRNWMYRNGYRNKPLYITEYGVLMPDGYGYGPFSPAEVSAYMTRTFDYLLNATDLKLGYPADGYRLVQHFSWYSINDKARWGGGGWQGFNGYLFDPDLGNQRSPMGDAYANYTAQLPSKTDLLITNIRFSPPAPPASKGPVTVTIQVDVGNAGNTVSAKDFTLRLYLGDPDQGGTFLTGAEFSGALKGCGDSRTFEYIWPNVAPGEYEIVAVIAPGVGVTDVQSLNNRLSRLFFFATDQVHLPLVHQP
ncbi:MAG: hypothetical protein NZ553_06480 [Caldilinea sp.]|nr:hypothetical protein [Caldilinea sp.]MDW8440097.1 hypothetical protein [Caldilineaceae bacterium]